MIEFLPDLTIIIDLGGKVIAWNKAAEKITGIKAEEMLGKNNYEYAIPFNQPIADIVRQHHERMNGTGYPQRLTGSQILLEASILAVADVVEAMASHRPYRPALGIDAALQEITDHTGTLYDGNVVDACLAVFRKGFSF